MNILFVLPEYLPHVGGGISTYYRDLIKALQRAGHTCTVLLGSGVATFKEDYTWENGSIYVLTEEVLALYKSKFKQFDLFPELRSHLAAAWALYDRAVELGPFDVVECVDWGLGYIPFALEQKFALNTQLHASIGQIANHDVFPGNEVKDHYIQLIETDTLKMSTCITAHSKSNKDHWEKLLSRKIENILPFYNPLPPKETKISKDYAVVIGRVQCWKGSEILCRALSLSERMDEIPDILWIGRDTDFQVRGNSYSRYLKNNYPNIWGKKILPVGRLPHEEVIEKLAGAKFGIVPSTWDVYNFTVLEYLSNRIPLIISVGAGAHEILESGVSALKYEQFNAAQLKECLEKMIAFSDDERAQLAENGYNAYAKNMDEDRLLNRRINLYNTCRSKFVASSPDGNASRYKNLYPSSATTNLPGLLDNQPIRRIHDYIKERLLSKLFSKH